LRKGHLIFAFKLGILRIKTKTERTKVKFGQAVFSLQITLKSVSVSPKEAIIIRDSGQPYTNLFPGSSKILKIIGVTPKLLSLTRFAFMIPRRNQGNFFPIF